MVNAVVSLTIPEADVARVKLAAEAFTGLPSTATPKELLAALVRQVVVQQERQTNAFTPPGIT
jgi:hypothetical protein